MKNFDDISVDHKKLLVDIGKEIKALRTAKGKSYIPLAKEIGISRNTYYLMECGKINFQLTSLMLILDYYGVSIPDFFKNLPQD